MADQELNIILKLRDELTRELARIGTSIDELARRGAEAGNTASRGVVEGLRQAARSASDAARTVETAAAEAGVSVASAMDRGAQATSRLGDEARETRQELAPFGAGVFDAVGDEAIRAGKAVADMAEAARVASADAQKLGAAGRESGQQVSAAARLGETGNRALRATLEAAAAAARNFGTVAVSAGRLAQTAFRQVGSAVSSIGGLFSGVTRSLRTAFTGLLPIATIAGVGIGLRSAASAASEFSRAMTEVRTIVNENIVDVGELRGQVLELARAHGTNETALTRGLYEVLSSGVEDAGRALSVLTTANKLAIAGNAQLEQTVDLLTSSINAYARENLAAARAADVLQKSVDLGKVRIEELGTSFGRVLPLGASLGVSFEELAAFIATASIRGLQTDEAITGLRGTLTAMLNVTEDGQRTLNQFGVSFDPATIRAKGLARTLIDLNNAVGGDTAALRDLFPEVRGLVSVLNVLSDGGEGLNETLSRLESSSGKVQRAFEIQMADPARRLATTLNTVRQSFTVAFGDRFFASANTAVDSFGGVEEAGRKAGEAAEVLASITAEGLGVIISTVPDAITAFADLTASMGGAETVAANIGATLRGVIGSFSGIARVFRAELVGVVEIVREVFDTFDRGVNTLQSNRANDLIQEARASLQEFQAILQTEATPEAISGVTERLNTQLRQTLGADAIEIPVTANLEEFTAATDAALEQLQPGRLDFGALFGRIQEISTRTDQEIRSALNQTGEGIKSVYEGISGDAGRAAVQAAQSASEPVRSATDIARASLQETLGDIDTLETAIKRLQVETAVVIERGAGSDLLGPVLASQAEKAGALQDALNAANDARLALNQRLGAQIDADIERLQSKVALLETGFHDARSEAELLGITDPGQLAIAVEAIGDRAGFSRSRLEELRAEIARLQSERDALQPPEPRQQRDLLGEAITAPLRVAARIDARALASEITRQIREALDAEQFDIAASLFNDRAIVEARLRAREAAQQILGEFATIEDAQAAVENALAIPDVDIGFVRELADALVNLLDNRTRLAGAADDERAALHELVNERARELEQLGALDAAGQARLRTASELADRLSRGERISGDFGPPRSSDEEISAIREEADAWQELLTITEQRLASRGEQSAFTEQEIAESRARAEASREEREAQAQTNEAREAARQFREEHPFATAAAIDGARGFAAAVTDVAFGFKNARQAFADFATNFLARIVQMQIEALALRAIVSAFPALGPLVGGAARGAVVPAERGLVASGGVSAERGLVASGAGIAAARGLVVPVIAGGATVHAAERGAVVAYETGGVPAPPAAEVVRRAGASSFSSADSPRSSAALPVSVPRGTVVRAFAEGGAVAPDRRASVAPLASPERMAAFADGAPLERPPHRAPATVPVLPYADGGVPELRAIADRSESVGRQTARDMVGAAADGAPAARIRSNASEFEAGGVPIRAFAEEVPPTIRAFADGGIPSLPVPAGSHRPPAPEVRAFADGGVPALPAPVRAFAVGDTPSRSDIPTRSDNPSISDIPTRPPTRSRVALTGRGILSVQAASNAALQARPDLSQRGRQGSEDRPPELPGRPQRTVSDRIVRDAVEGIRGLTAPERRHSARTAPTAPVTPFQLGAPSIQAAFRAARQLNSVPRNEVVRAPTTAPLALFGEAGPEAIMPLVQGRRGLSVVATMPSGEEIALPLQRARNGKLGVSLLGTSARPETARQQASQAFQDGGIFRRQTTSETVASLRTIGPEDSAITSAPVSVEPERRIIEIRTPITIEIRTLDGRSATSVLMEHREVIAQAVASEIRRSPAVRAAVRGDAV